jgi:hypothetical protein
MYAYLDTYSGSSTNSPAEKDAATNMKNKLASLTGVTLNVSGDAEIIPNDLGYVNFLTRYVNNQNSPSIKVNVSGYVTFGSGTDYYSTDTIASVITDKFTLSASGTITLPA